MTRFLMQLPPFLGPVVAALISLTITAGLFIAAHWLFRGQRPKTPTFVQQMAIRIGTMHALVVALVFSILTGQLIRQYDLSDEEALSAANIYFILVENQSESATHIRKLVPEYLNTIIKQDWGVYSQRPYELPAWKLIAQMRQILLDWRPASPSDEMIKQYVFKNLNTIAKNRNNRIIESQAPILLPIFWGIAFGGYILTLVPYMCVHLTRLRFFLICCYAIMIGLMFYGIASLDNPFLSRAIKPTSFEVMYNDITAGQKGAR